MSNNEQEPSDHNQSMDIIHDILNDHPPLSSDPSFTASIGADGQPMLASLPVDLQNLFNTQEDLWNRPDSSVSMPAPASFFQHMPILQQPQLHATLPPSTATPPQSSQQIPLQLPPSHVQPPLMQHPLPHQFPTSFPSIQAPTTSDLMNRIMMQIPPERKAQFQDICGQFENHAISPEDFKKRANALLGSTGMQPLDPNVSMSDLPASLPHHAMMAHQRRPIAIPPAMPSASTAPANVQVPRNIAVPSPAVKAAAAGTAPTTTATSSSATTSGPSGDRIDFDTITDVMGYAGVDLKEEVEHFWKDGDVSAGVFADGVDRSKYQDFMHPELLMDMVLKTAKPLSISKIDPDFLSYLSLATQDRLRTLIEYMIDASKRRTRDQFSSPPINEQGCPMYKIVVQQDTKKQLDALARVDRKRRGESVQDDDEDAAKRSRVDEQGNDKKSWVLTGQGTLNSEAAVQPIYRRGQDRVLAHSTREDARLVTVRDALFALEYDSQSGPGGGQRTLLKLYNHWLR